MFLQSVSLLSAERPGGRESAKLQELVMGIA
jgi:hypothetical protein